MSNSHLCNLLHTKSMYIATYMRIQKSRLNMSVAVRTCVDCLGEEIARRFIARFHDSGDPTDRTTVLSFRLVIILDLCDPDGSTLARLASGLDAICAIEQLHGW